MDQFLSLALGIRVNKKMQSGPWTAQYVGDACSKQSYTIIYIPFLISIIKTNV